MSETRTENLSEREKSAESSHVADAANRAERGDLNSARGERNSQSAPRDGSRGGGGSPGADGQRGGDGHGQSGRGGDPPGSDRALANVSDKATKPEATAANSLSGKEGGVGNARKVELPPSRGNPEKIFSENPTTRANWESALEKVFQKGSYEKNIEAFQAEVAKRPTGSGRTAGTKQQYARETFDKVRGEFYKQEAENPSYNYTNEQRANLEKGKQPDYQAKPKAKAEGGKPGAEAGKGTGSQPEAQAKPQTEAGGGKPGGEPKAGTTPELPTRQIHHVEQISKHPERALDPQNLMHVEGSRRGTTHHQSHHGEGAKRGQQWNKDVEAGKRPEAKPAEVKPTEGKGAEGKPAEPKPAEPKPAEPKPAEPKPAEPKTEGTTAGKPADPKPEAKEPKAKGPEAKGPEAKGGSAPKPEAKGPEAKGAEAKGAPEPKPEVKAPKGEVPEGKLPSKLGGIGGKLLGVLGELTMALDFAREIEFVRDPDNPKWGKERTDMFGVTWYRGVDGSWSDKKRDGA